jgi:hypothetical protein
MHDLPTLLSAEDKLKEKFEKNRKYIADALEYSGGTHSIEDVYQACAVGEAQLHPLEKSCIITEVVDYPSLTVCRIWLAGGDLDELVEAEKSIAVWAKAQGCDAMEINGRKGWQRQLKDYTATSVVLTKDLRDE